ncbi:MAG: hypothetical protein RIC14_15545 [Filomicrobium sp.]
MSGENILGTVASVAVLIAAGFFVTMTSLAAFNAASFSPDTCTYHTCITLASSY